MLLSQGNRIIGAAQERDATQACTVPRSILVQKTDNAIIHFWVGVNLPRQRFTTLDGTDQQRRLATLQRDRRPPRSCPRRSRLRGRLRLPAASPLARSPRAAGRNSSSPHPTQGSASLKAQRPATDCANCPSRVIPVNSVLCLSLGKHAGPVSQPYGTGSCPCPPHGWQRPSRFIVSHPPLRAPYFRKASIEYWLHEGV